MNLFFAPVHWCTETEYLHHYTFLGVAMVSIITEVIINYLINIIKYFRDVEVSYK